MKMEIGFIDSVRFIISPFQPNLKQQRRKKVPINCEIATWRQPLYKEIRGSRPRHIIHRSASNRKRKRLLHAVSRRVPNGWIALV